MDVKEQVLKTCAPENSRDSYRFLGMICGERF